MVIAIVRMIGEQIIAIDRAPRMSKLRLANADARLTAGKSRCSIESTPVCIPGVGDASAGLPAISTGCFTVLRRVLVFSNIMSDSIAVYSCYFRPVSTNNGRIRCWDKLPICGSTIIVHERFRNTTRIENKISILRTKFDIRYIERNKSIRTERFADLRRLPCAFRDRANVDRSKVGVK